MASGDDDDILPVVRVDDLQEYARRHLPPNAWNYYSSGANDENLLRETRKAYARWLLRARVLRGARVPPDTTCHVVGGTVRSPICVAPTAMQRMAHPDGEIGTGSRLLPHDAFVDLFSSELPGSGKAGRLLHVEFVGNDVVGGCGSGAGDSRSQCRAMVPTVRLQRSVANGGNDSSRVRLWIPRSCPDRRCPAPRPPGA